MTRCLATDATLQQQQPSSQPLSANSCSTVEHLPTQQQHSNGSTVIVTANSGNGSKREPAGVSATKAKSEIQKFYQIKEKVMHTKLLLSLSRMDVSIFALFNTLRSWAAPGGGQELSLIHI